jgi:hypothetical protein
MRLLFLAASLLLTTACAHNQVSVTTPTTPPPTGEVSNDTPAPTSANTVDPVPARVLITDTTARPQWLKARIAAVLSERKRNPITRILKYQYEGKTVYYQSAPCCDQYSQVFDTNGNLICQPDGGITGKGDGKCADFEKNKSNEKLVWQDPR